MVKSIASWFFDSPLGLRERSWCVATISSNFCVLIIHGHIHLKYIKMPKAVVRLRHF